MKDNARKYNLDVCNLISYGIGASGTSCQCSILNSFAVQCENVTVSYASITTQQLAQLPNLQYDQRVLDYLKYVNIESEATKECLLTGATYYDPVCENLCKLNEEFLVYVFLNGIRIVNIGTVYGEAQYKAYPEGADPSLYSWQTNGTFLGIDMNNIYVFEVRDYWNGATHCMVQKTISLPTLVPSTTVTPQSKLVYINEISVGTTGSLNFNIGCMGLDPALVNNEKVSVSYDIGVNTIGDGFSCIELTCKPAGCGTFLPYNCLTNVGVSAMTGSFTLCAGDTMCYNSSVVASTAGSCGYSYFDLNSVNGLSTTIPTIDVGRCSECVTNSIPKTDVTIYTYRTTDSSTSTTCEQKGCFVFMSPIPVGQSITLDLSGSTTRTIDGTSSYQIWCKPNAVPLFTKIIDNTHLNPQPHFGSVTVNSGDEICYVMNTTVNSAGSSAVSAFNICDASGSFGINPIIGSPYGDIITQTVASTPITVSVCSQHNTMTSPPDDNAEMNGFINAPGIGAGQCVGITTNKDITLSSSFNAMVEFRISCQPNGSTGFAEIVHSTGCESSLPPTTDTFYMCIGDCVCYCARAVAMYPTGEAAAFFCLDSVSGIGGVIPTINPDTNKQSDVIVAVNYSTP